LGIAPHQSSAPTRWTSAMLRDLAHLSQIQFAQRYGVSSHTMHAKRVELGVRSPWRFPEKFTWPRRHLQRLGRMTDAAMAHSLGISESLAREERIRRGIAAYTQRSVVAWTAARVALLGRQSDSAVAALLDTNRKVVTAERYRRGIAAYAWWSTRSVRIAHRHSSPRLGKAPQRQSGARPPCRAQEAVPSQKMELGSSRTRSPSRSPTPSSWSRNRRAFS
jgi:hypothetical protein